jgi:hypothetical protein
VYFNPPYVGSSGWIGIDLAAIRDDALQAHLREAWRLVAGKIKTDYFQIMILSFAINLILVSLIIWASRPRTILQ